MKTIPLTKGKVAQVDDNDYEWLSQSHWFAANVHGYYYAAREIKGKVYLMHRVILGLDVGDPTVADHIDHNGLNNTRANLRKATRQQNCANRLNQAHTSRYKGVMFWKERGKWRARIRHLGHSTSLGLFATELEAAKAYDAKALELHGEFALTNAVIFGGL
jgi:hypothetical protein